MKSRDAGFTLIEVIVVIAIMSIIAGTLAPSISQRIDRARRDATKAEMNEIKEALTSFGSDTGIFPKQEKDGPTSLKALETKSGKYTGWRGPYMVGRYANADYAYDAWNTPYLYRYVSGERTATLTSLGSDRSVGGNDDISMTVLMPMEDIESRIARTRETLKLVGGDIYGNNPVAAPGKYTAPKQWSLDDWGNKIIYLNYNGNSSVVYSPGPDGVDNNLTGDDIFFALVWEPLSNGGNGGDTGGGGNGKKTKKNKNKNKKKKG
ncbi:MAG: type II secretion system protein GspG [Thermodesulfobacteriota bacterium]